MTIIEKSHTNENYYITLDIEEGKYGGYYVVRVCPRISDCMCGYPVREYAYPLTEKEKAYNAFKRYQRKYI